MQQVTRIPIWRTFLNWIISVIAGSILWPLVMSLFESGPYRADDVWGLMVISAIFAAGTSLPAMLILLLVNWQLNKQEMPRRQYHGIHIGIHLGVAFLTFLVIYLFAAGDLGRDKFPFIVLAFTYTIVGMTCWLITFGIYRKKQVHRTELRDDILDEL